MCDAPEKEQDTSGTHQGVHDVYPITHLCRVTGKLAEEIGYEHEERCAGRVSYFKFVSCGDEFWTIPKAGGRLYGAAISEGCYHESNPTHQIVHKFVLFHEINMFVNV
jgi:hypothetical protein